MQFKKYQLETLKALEDYFTYARAEGPAKAFARFNEAQPYLELDGMPETPYVCLRLPTGGGKTILAAKTIQIAGNTLLGVPYPITIWMVPSDPIKQQTIDALNDTSHAYRKMLDDAFDGNVRIFDIDRFSDIRPVDLEKRACIVVSTIQSFRVEDTSNRTVYKHHEDMEPHFSKAYVPDGLERVSESEAAQKGLTAGDVKFSFANLLYLARPIMIVDEAHNAVSNLSAEVQKRLRPSAIIEFTATPRGRNNILHSVTASALKDEEMIKLPIILKTEADWRTAVTAAVAKRNVLHEKGAKDKDRIKPVVLYQAQPGKSEANPDGILKYLMEVKLIPRMKIALAYGSHRELDGINFKDGTTKIEHVITIEALREGWDCPTAYILCATQKIASATKVEQLLGRVLRMPGAERRKDPALNKAYAFVSDPSIQEVASTLRDKLLSMGFTDEEAGHNLQTSGYGRDERTGDLFDVSDEDAPVFEHRFEDNEKNREAADSAREHGADVIENDDGTLTIAASGEISDELDKIVENLTPEDKKDDLAQKRKDHKNKLDAAKSPAEKGTEIEVPGLASMVQGELLFADDETIFEADPWTLKHEPPVLTEEELNLNKLENFVSIDLNGEKIIYENTSGFSKFLPGFQPTSVGASEASFLAIVERQCRVSSLPQQELSQWLSGVISDLISRRKMTLRDLVDWEPQIVTAIKSKLRKLHQASKARSHQMALFSDDADLQIVENRFTFKDGIYADVPRHKLPVGMVMSKHLLGSRTMPRLDGKKFGEEMQCAAALNGMEDVDVWVRNVSQHRDSFRLIRPSGLFYYPDFVAKLNDGRIFVVEYKGDQLINSDETREKSLVAQRWASTSGNLYGVIERMKHGKGMAEQIFGFIHGA